MAWHLMNVAEVNSNWGAHKEFQMDNASEIANEPTDQGSIPPGSFAYGPGFDPFYVKCADGTWVEC